MSGARAWLRLIPVAVLVTAVLAGVTIWVRADGIEGDLAGRSRSALAAAGIRGGDVSFSGRTATLSGFPAEQAGRALGIVQGVEGVESAQVSGGAAAVPPSVTSAPPTTTTSPPRSSSSAPPSTTSSAPPTDRAGVQKELDAQLAEAPIEFKPNTTQLTPEGTQAARDVAKLLKSAPASLRYRITGHVAEGPGGRASAVRLSQSRARVVVRLLTAGGVPANRLLVRGTGTAAPGEGGDRRVEITVEER
ncbi:OmpA family protein [Amycolatopsis rhabdoformis]|uniref:OmpA family protein n=1 Tax=Amycolatopsis rhabdoformis TaxID=1448059 RepID=A0ABZ1HZQ4_9PSEU|nr:OmpA family protein [Amycolatopsis rhabdoformis]WSE27614.1 OmpA family protein [Amycolatopsis rhabdoformis]